MNKIRFSGIHYAQIQQHLYSGDDNEAVAIALCGRSIHNNNHTLTVQEIFLVPYESCIERRPDFVHWQTDIIIPLLEKAALQNLAVLKIHSHPIGYEAFSKYDDKSDNELFAGIDALFDNQLPNASCIMLPSGRIFGRFIYEQFRLEPVHQISVAGSNIQNWYYANIGVAINDELQLRNMQTFGEGTIKTLNKLKVGVVGCSGTGSPVIEQLKRLGVGELVLVDPDYIDKVNMNRIVNATFDDAVNKRGKAEVMRRSVEEAGFGTRVTIFESHITEYNVIKELADCDILIGCVDGSEGRHILNQISSYYVLPYIDLGVRIDADGQGGINGIFGTVNYIQPGGSSLLSREVYTTAKLAAESMKRTDVAMYTSLERSKYLASVNESSPAVISVNMQVAATAMNELLARIHKYRNVDNHDVDVIRIFFGEIFMLYESSPIPCEYFCGMVGKGDIDPLLNNPSIENDQKAA